MAGVSATGADQKQNEVMQRLHDDHMHIATVLEALEKELAAEDIDWGVVADIIAYLQEYPDAVHHPLEDQLFDRVLDKGLSPAERELVHFNLAQHAEIIAATQSVADDVNKILSDIVVPIDQLLDHFERYVELQRIHMRNENTHLFPLAERLLSGADWSEVAVEAAAHTDPMFEVKQGRYAALYRRMTEAQPEAD